MSRTPKQLALIIAMASGLASVLILSGGVGSSAAQAPAGQTSPPPVVAAAHPASSVSDPRCGHGGWIRVEARNRELLHRYHVEVWEEGHFDRAVNYLAPGFVAHSIPVLPNGQQPGPDFLARFLGAFSNLVSHEDAILAGCDRVAIQWTITATQTGDFFGIPPTQRTVQFSGMDVLRVQDGKFTDQWGGIADQVDDVVAQLTGPAPAGT
jgi:predicted ester cyclase